MSDNRFTGFGRVEESVPGRASASGAGGRAFSYGVAGLIGLAAVFFFIPIAAIRGDGGLWSGPLGVDLAQNLTGHLIFQRPGWRWPPLFTPDLFWPRGESIAMTDSNPLVSLIAKLLAQITGKPRNLLGWWFAVCWFSQPVAAVYAVRGFGARRWEAAVEAAIFAVSFPAWLVRVGHINLCGQFLILIALGLSARMIRREAGTAARDWAAAYAALLAAVMVHPYLFVMAAAVLAAPAIQAAIDRRPRRWRPACWFLTATALAFLPFKILSGDTGGADSGFGVYSMNLLSPVWPQLSGVFGAGLKMIDATGGQNEGFNYLGAGGLLLILAAIVAGRGFPGWRRWRGLIVVLGILTLLALSTQVYAGRILLLPLGVRPWDAVFGVVRSSGRLFWPVGYALLLGSIAILTRQMRRPMLDAVLIVAATLQVVDSGPLRRNARDYFAGIGPSVTRPALPDGIQLLATLPVCARTPGAASTAALLRLDAARDGAKLSDVKLSRLPSWFSCERALTDGLELPLSPGEVRVLLEPAATGLMRRGAFGPDTECRRYDGAVLCANGLSLPAGDPVDSGAPLPSIGAPATLRGADLKPFLSYGWSEDAREAVFWSEGPRATLLAALPELPGGAGLAIRLTLEGIARSAGGNRPVSIQVGAGPPVEVVLADREITEIAVPVSAADVSGGVLRVAFDIYRPVDPARRGVAAPVSRAGLRLYGVALFGPPK